MAASDPTWGVPTPTGTLQGAAVFSWDGSAWQPSGRPGPSVATPTGVLRGVAPFSWDGSLWQPSGYSGPGVPTPTGTLDGIALYTWNGSAWTPAGGGSHSCATRSGTLLGVAGFYWDGTAWQPAGQASPEVATPMGVLAGMAIFSWSGSAWVPASAASPPTLDLNFVGTSTLDPRITFSRSSVATYFDATGTMQTAGNNVARFDYDPVTHVSNGLFVEEARTNLLLNSATLSTQSVTTTAQNYTLSFYGTGSVTLSGTSTGTTTGSGAFPARVSTTFTPTAGTLTLTVSGSVLNAQLEAGAFRTSYIPTAGASATRATESAVATGLTLTAGAAGASVALEAFALQNTVAGANCNWMLIDDGSAVNSMVMLNPASSANIRYGLTISSASVFSSGDVTTGTRPTIFKSGLSVATTQANRCMNGGTVASPGPGGTLPTLTRVNFGGGAVTQPNGYMRRFRYWPRALSNAELQQVTT